MVPIIDRTVREVQEWLRRRRSSGEGLECPCCGQYVKTYKRLLNVEVAYFMTQLVARYVRTREWVDIKDFKLRGGDYAKAAYWGLAENAPNVDPKKRTSGLWRPTLKGIQFVREELEVPRYAMVYNGTVESLWGTPIGIREALSKRFSYDRLMAGVPL